MQIKGCEEEIFCLWYERRREPDILRLLLLHYLFMQELQMKTIHTYLVKLSAYTAGLPVR